MATYQSIYVGASPTAATLFTGTLGAGGTASVVLAPHTLFAVTVAATSNIRFGNATRVPTATVADFPIWGSTVQEWDTGQEFDRISLFSTAGGAYWVYVLSATK